MSEEYLNYKKSFVRTILNFLILFSVLTGFYQILFAKNFHFGFNLLFSAPLILLLPRFIYTHFDLDKTHSINLIKFLESIFISGFIVSALGSLWLYRVNLFFDWFTHLFIGCLLTLIFSIILLIYRPKIFQRRVGVFGFYLMIPLSGIWEVYEFLGDKIFGSRMFGDWFRPAFIDTIGDIALTISGAAIASYLIYQYWNFFWKITYPKNLNRNLTKI